MAETQPLLQPHNAPNRHPWYRLRISQSPAKAYYVIPLCCALGMLVGMVQAPLVQFVVSLVCSREAKTLQDTFHKPNTAVASHIFAIGRPREECESDATVQALSSRVLLVIQFCSALLCKYRWSCAFVLFGCMPLIYVAPVTALCTTGFYSALADKRGRRFVFIINASVSIISNLSLCNRDVQFIHFL
jgi:hypothetical protein